MSNLLIVAAHDLKTARDDDGNIRPLHRKGEVIEVLDGGADPGAQVRLPHLIRLTITDSTRGDVERYREFRRRSFTTEIEGQNPTRFLVKIRIDPSLLAASETGEIKRELRDYLEDPAYLPLCEYRPLDSSPGVLAYRVYKPADIGDLRGDINDKFGRQLLDRQYYLPSAWVDTTAGTGGVASMTLAQFQLLVSNRLNE